MRLLLLLGLLLWPMNSVWAELPIEMSQRVERLLPQLNDDAAAAREQAEDELFKLAPLNNADQCDEYLALLPRPVDSMPAEVKQRLERLRRRIETEQANRVLAATRLTLDAQQAPLATVLEQIENQTGNRLNDHREQFGQQAAPQTVTLQVEDKEFWPTVDRLLDQVQMTTYPYSDEEVLALVNREPDALARQAAACYAGPFRIEAATVFARRNLRKVAQEGLQVELEIAWEPRLRPIALSQPIETLQVTADDGSTIELDDQMAVLQIEVTPGSHATELAIPLELPPRSVNNLASFKGQLSALVPGRQVEFKFTDLDKPKSSTQQRGGVLVEMQGVRNNHELWEVHMRLRVESDEPALESHRGWVLQNRTYLLNPQGEVIDHAGLETTMQSEREVGLAYFFDLPDETLAGYTWVYRTPAAIVRTTVEYELKGIPLP